MTLQPTTLPLPVHYQTSEARRPGLHAGACLWNSALSLLGCLRSVRARALRRRRLRALRQLDDRLLADIGLTRCEIEFMRHGDWRFPS
jgi:uncharacterized protein YjiS (DUF1127 family)